MSAPVIPFPKSQNRPWCASLAGRLTKMRPAVAEQHLRARLNDYRDRLISQGVEPALAERTASDLEGAVRGELWRLLLGGADVG